MPNDLGVRPRENETLSATKFRNDYELKVSKGAVVEFNFDLAVAVGEHAHLVFRLRETQDLGASLS
ncbi:MULTISPECIES: hypothetical protein [Cryobacterium]|uniref:hypothetical protein n=1 Tax=Cryobacterium TaxID=69578 RepID=UPI001580D5B9